MQGKSLACVLKMDYIFFPSCLLIFHSFIWVYILPQNPSSKFLFGSMLVPFGCLLPNHVLRGRDKEATATLEMGKQSQLGVHTCIFK